MRLRWILLLTGIALLASAVWVAPAATLYAWWAPASEWRLIGVDGRLARGQAQALLQGDEVRATPLRWQLRPWRLLIAQAVWQIDFGGVATGQAEARLTPLGQLRLRGLRVAADAAPLLAAAGYPGLPLRGTAGVELARIDLGADGWPRHVEGEARLLDLGWTLGNQVTVFGDIHAQISLDEQGQLLAELQAAADAAVEVSGQARLAADGAYDVDLRLRARAQAAPQVANLLRLLGQPDAQGDYRIRQRGRLR